MKALPLPPPLAQAPPPGDFWQDLWLLAALELRLTRNKLRQWPLRIWLLIGLPLMGFLALLIYLGYQAFSYSGTLTPGLSQGILSFAFLAGVAGNLLFGAVAAFTTLFMSEDLEMLFVAPVTTRAVFAIKTLKIAVSNFFTTSFFVLLPGLFIGLLSKAPFFYYFQLVLVFIGLLVLGTALAELLNLVIMRVVPPHRGKEAVGFISALSGILIALLFQIPSLVIAGGGLAHWLDNQSPFIAAMDLFPWGWGAKALTTASSGNQIVALLWSLLTLAFAALLLAPAFLLVEKGFRRGWIALSQGSAKKALAVTAPQTNRQSAHKALTAWQPFAMTSPLRGMWAVAKKDLLTIKRDTREWFGYLTPLLLAAFFVGRALFLPGEGANESLIMILALYTIMFSGNMASQSFGREGESDWLLNSVPLAGWPVVWGKLLGAVLPTLVLMELLLAGSGIALGLSLGTVAALAVGAFLVTVSGSAVGLFYSINHCRYNPENPRPRISFGAALVMFIINTFLTALLGLGVLYTFAPEPAVFFARLLPIPGFDAGLWTKLLYTLTRPLTWDPGLAIALGLFLTLGVWIAIFFAFVGGAVRKSRQGFKVQLVTSFNKKPRRLI